MPLTRQCRQTPTKVYYFTQGLLLCKLASAVLSDSSQCINATWTVEVRKLRTSLDSNLLQYTDRLMNKLIFKLSFYLHASNSFLKYCSSFSTLRLMGLSLYQSLEEANNDTALLIMVAHHRAALLLHCNYGVISRLANLYAKLPCRLTSLASRAVRLHTIATTIMIDSFWK